METDGFQHSRRQMQPRRHLDNSKRWDRNAVRARYLTFGWSVDRSVALMPGE